MSASVGVVGGPEVRSNLVVAAVPVGRHCCLVLVLERYLLLSAHLVTMLITVPRRLPRTQVPRT